MSDLHQMPLRGHDLPEYSVNLPVVRVRVDSRRAVTGQLYWYWTRPVLAGGAVVAGPFLSCADAHNDIERSREFRALY